MHPYLQALTAAGSPNCIGHLFFVCIQSVVSLIACTVKSCKNVGVTHFVEWYIDEAPEYTLYPRLWYLDWQVRKPQPLCSHTPFLVSISTPIFMAFPLSEVLAYYLSFAKPFHLCLFGSPHQCLIPSWIFLVFSETQDMLEIKHKNMNQPEELRKSNGHNLL